MSVVVSPPSKLHHNLKFLNTTSFPAMTIILDLSKEILLLIFEKLPEDKEDLKQCQLVCRIWYPIAHCLLLNNVEFDTYSQIKSFNASFEINPKQSYVNAVRQIAIYDLDDEAEDDEGNAVSPPILLGKENIKKLFFRFPNLHQITIINAFWLCEEFDDEICEMFLNDCSKLEEFIAAVSSYRYCALLHKFRLLQTVVDIGSIFNIVPDATKFLADFPRLKNLIDYKGHLDTLQKWLPVLEHAPNLTALTITLKEGDEPGFAENYLATKTKVEQRLYLHCSPGAFVNSLKFVAKYFTDLTKIHVERYLDKPYGDISQLLSLSIMLSLPVSRRSFEMRGTYNTLHYILPVITNKIFHQTASNFKTPNKVLQLFVVDEFDVDLEYIRFSSDQNPTKQHITITVTHLYELMSSNSYPLDDIEEFKLTFSTKSVADRTDVYFYDGVLGAFPLLKKVHLCLPTSFVKTKYLELKELASPHPLVQDATLQAKPNTACQALLDSWCLAFPNLRQLSLHYFSGIWREYIGEFQVELGKYMLECLTVDVTPLKTKMHKEQLTKDDFFVVEVEILQNNERLLYKLPFDLSQAVSIANSDLNGFVRGEDYNNVHVTIKSLQRLELLVDQHRMTIDESTCYSRGLNLEHVSRITLFDKGE